MNVYKRLFLNRYAAICVRDGSECINITESTGQRWLVCTYTLYHFRSRPLCRCKRAHLRSAASERVFFGFFFFLLSMMKWNILTTAHANVSHVNAARQMSAEFHSKICRRLCFSGTPACHFFILLLSLFSPFCDLFTLGSRFHCHRWKCTKLNSLFKVVDFFFLFLNYALFGGKKAIQKHHWTRNLNWLKWSQLKS